jgi:hypothetical protein
MGQHKYNPTAIAAKNGELDPKLRRMGKRERDRLIQAMITSAMLDKTGLAPSSDGGILVKDPTTGYIDRIGGSDVNYDF